MNNLLRFYKLMLIIRYFEERVEALFTKGLVKGTAHPAIGQEAIAVGVCSVLRKKDYVTSTHRGHGHFIAKGGAPRRIMAELFGKATGYSGGRGGSQLMADYSLGFLGGNGITGGSIPFATGVALCSKLKRTGRVTVCFFGDGASNQGTFHESLNMAGLWRLPIIYICENNMYAMSTPVHQAMAIKDIATRATSYGFSGEVVDGNDFFAVREATQRAHLKARRLEGPTLLECKTYRLSGHSRGDPGLYRPADEVKEAWRNDPIVRFRHALYEREFLSKGIESRIRREAKEAVDDAVRFAKHSPFPDCTRLEEGLLA